MRIVVDFSDYQAGLDLDTVAAYVDGAWAKAGDWSWIRAHGWPGDSIHDAAVTRFNQLGRPIGSYFFVRPGWTDPGTQINWWADRMPAGTTVVPMIDLETAGTLSGGSLTDWVDEALAICAARFGVIPVLYWSAAFQSGNGMGLPSTPHRPMVAEYHRGYSPFLWSDRSWWETTAYSAYGGPDVPAGYGMQKIDMIWQFTSSAQVPGFAGLVDCSFCTEGVWAQITDPTLGPASPVPIPIPPPPPEDEDMLTQIVQTHSDVPIPAGGRDWGDGTVWLIDYPRAWPVPDQYTLGVLVATGLVKPPGDDTAGHTYHVDAATIRNTFILPDEDPGSAPSNDADVLAALGVLTSATDALHGKVDAVATAVAASPPVDQAALASNVADAVVAASPPVDQAVFAQTVADAVVAATPPDSGGGGESAAAIAQAVIGALGEAISRPPPADPVSGDDPPALQLADPNPAVRAATALATMTSAVFDRQGLVEQTRLRLAKIRLAPGQTLTVDDHLNALQGALADIAARAGLHAQTGRTTPPPPPPPPAAG